MNRSGEVQAVLDKIREAAFANRGSEVGTAYANAGEWLRAALNRSPDSPENSSGVEEGLDEIEDSLREVLADPHAAVGDPYVEEPIENWQARAVLEVIAPRLRGHASDGEWTDRLHRWLAAEAVGAKNHQRTCEKSGHSREAYAAAGRATALEEVAARIPATQPVSPQPDPTTRLSEGTGEVLTNGELDNVLKALRVYAQAFPEPNLDSARTKLEALRDGSAPRLSRRGEEGLRERLLSDEAINAVTEVLDDEFAAATSGEAVTDYALAKRLLSAALATTQKPQDEGDS